MGSPSSTRWNGHVRHRTELEACAIATAHLKPMLREWLETSGRYEARSSRRIVLGARIVAGRVTRDDFGALSRTLTIDYDLRPAWKDRIRLTPVPGRFGGLVWFLCCPTCDRRVRTLYVPLGPALPELAKPARCRACCGLRYHTQRYGPERRLTSWCCVRRNASTRVCDVWMKLSTARPRNRSGCTGCGMSSSPPNTRKHARPATMCISATCRASCGVRWRVPHELGLGARNRPVPVVAGG